MLIAIEVFDLDARDASVRIDINGMPRAAVAGKSGSTSAEKRNASVMPADPA